MRVTLLTAALLCCAALTGCDQWFNVRVDPDMQQTLHLASDEVASSEYPRLRERYDAIKRQEADAVAAKARREADDKAAEAAKVARQEGEAATKAQRELDASVASAKRRHADAVALADANLAGEVATLGANAQEVIANARFRAAEASTAATAQISRIQADAADAVKAIDAGRESVIRSSDEAYRLAKAQQAQLAAFASDAGGVVLPVVASLLGGGALGTIVTGLWAAVMRRRDKAKLDETKGELGATSSALDAVTHGLQIGKEADLPLPTDVKTVADAVRLITKQFIASQATKADEVVIDKSAAGAGVT